MANKREIINRRNTVSNIRKITKTMEMIATARFKKSYDRAVGSRPYTERIAQLTSALSSAGGPIEHPLLQQNDESKTVLLVLTSNRGLCGGYNGNILREASDQIDQLERQKKDFDLRVSGKKGIGFFRFAGRESSASYTGFDEKLTYADTERLADEFMKLYEGRQIDSVRVVYTKFVSISRLQPEVLTLLPLGEIAGSGADQAAGLGTDQYIFSPSAAEILRQLIPATVRTALFQCFLDAVLTEQIARMRAMKAATDNAQKMIRALTQQYNRVRQTQITGELLDILGGAEVLK